MERRGLRAEGFVPTEAKLQAPARLDGLVLRGQLVDHLIESADVPVVLVTGPPGYGKTVLVGQWAEEDERPFAWLALDQDDNDPVVLLTYLMLALHRLEPVDAGILAALTADESSIEGEVLPRIALMLRRRRPFALVLDRSDAVTSPIGLQVLELLAEEMPAGAQLVLVGRTAPPLDWDGLRARRRLVELAADDLRLSRAEATALVKGVGLDLPGSDVDALLERTEGWAAAVYLAALALSDTVAQPTTVHTLSGSDRLIADYLQDQVFDALPPEDQTFLLRASVLDRLSAPLCDAVLSTTGSERTLQRLVDSNALVAVVDDGRWYRMHGLLADALRAELQRREPEVVKQLHSRAGRWLEDNGDPEEAIRHTIAAGEVDRAARLIWNQVPACLATGRLAALDAWLGSFTPRQVAAHAKLALTAAACTLQRGEPPDLWLSSAERGGYEAARPGESASVAAGNALLRAVIARHGVVQMGADAQLALELFEPDSPWRCTAGVVAAVSAYLTGEVAEARSELADVERLGRALGTHQCRALVLSQLAVVALDDDDWAGAHRLADEAEHLRREHHLDDLMTLLPLRCLSPLLSAHDGRRQEAEAAARQCAAKVAVVVNPPAWIAVQCRHLLARTQLVLGDTAAARSLLSEALELLGQVSDAGHLREQVERTWREVENTPLDAAGGASTLTTAELRVLQFLPTHLSFEEIGRQLFISRNTVKTQAVAAYRKLGVSSRTEAVERAYALGLITR